MKNTKKKFFQEENHAKNYCNKKKRYPFVELERRFFFVLRDVALREADRRPVLHFAHLQEKLRKVPECVTTTAVKKYTLLGKVLKTKRQVLPFGPVG
jgi:hypothetical protein